MGVLIRNKVWGIIVFTTMAKMGVGTPLAFDVMDI
jgi:hypothetical protein